MWWDDGAIRHTGRLQTQSQCITHMSDRAMTPTAQCSAVQCWRGGHLRRHSGHHAESGYVAQAGEHLGHACEGDRSGQSRAGSGIRPIPLKRLCVEVEFLCYAVSVSVSVSYPQWLLSR
jgi:hypothetical protein